MEHDNSPMLYVISGAGLSAESGIPTFRDAGGLWSQYNVDEVCNALTWKRNRSRVFEFYSLLRERYAPANPNAGHFELATWQAQWGANRVRLLTQNVDSLLEAAGASAVTHLHGSLLYLQCLACSTRWEHSIDVAARCPKCNSLKGVKPGVVLFHEYPPEYALLRKMYKKLRPQDIIVFVGSAFEVISPEEIVPPKLWGSERIINVNPVHSDSVVIGTHIEAPAGTGLARARSLLESWMAAE